MSQNKISTKVSEINIGDLIVAEVTYYLVLENEEAKSETGRETRKIKTLRLTDCKINIYTFFSSDTLWVFGDS